MPLRVVLELASKRSFASALDWPGWSRGARTVDDALESLLAYAPRYAPVAFHAKLLFEPPSNARGFEIVERLEGDAVTDFGVPRASARLEDDPLPSSDLERMLAILEACWWTFDRITDAAVSVALALGPRGGGRSLDKISRHVRDGEAAYLTKVGARAPAQDRPIAELHAAFADAVTARATGRPLANPSRTKTLWSPATLSAALPGMCWTTPGRSKTAQPDRQA